MPILVFKICHRLLVFVTILSLVLLGGKKTAARDGVDDDVPRDDERGGAGATTTRRISLDVFFFSVRERICRDDELTQSGCPIARSLILSLSPFLFFLSFSLPRLFAREKREVDVFMHLLER